MLSLYDGIAIDFNPRSHKGNDASVTETMQVKTISIHVPTRGTTSSVPSVQLTIVNFNPRSHKGNDTPLTFPYHTFPLYFNPRSHKGNDNLQRILWKIPGEFQSTFPQGERHFPGTIISSLCRFQSTFPQGERQKVNYYPVTITAISIHVPTRGTTLYSMMSLWILLFQSTFPQGERRREPGGGD